MNVSDSNVGMFFSTIFLSYNVLVIKIKPTIDIFFMKSI